MHNRSPGPPGCPLRSSSLCHTRRCLLYPEKALLQRSLRQPDLNYVFFYDLGCDPIQPQGLPAQAQQVLVTALCSL